MSARIHPHTRRQADGQAGNYFIHGSRGCSHTSHLAQFFGGTEAPARGLFLLFTETQPHSEWGPGYQAIDGGERQTHRVETHKHKKGIKEGSRETGTQRPRKSKKSLAGKKNSVQRVPNRRGITFFLCGMSLTHTLQCLTQCCACSPHANV